jgi:DNA mismatch repair protein MutL
MKELQPSLESTGFVFEAINADSVIISGLPVNISESETSIVLEDLLNDLQEGIANNGFSQNDSIARSMARSLAVKTGTYLSEKEQENLVNNLFACKEPNVSPFNKPTFITMSVEDIDKKFSI